MTPPARALAALFAVAALAVVPTALSSWRHGGLTEPSTPEDEGWMFPESDAGTGQPRIYFNAYLVQSTRPEGAPSGSEASRLGGDSKWWDNHPNPNAVEGMRVAPVGAVRLNAILGIWKDCNRDGYIGDARTGLLTYPPAFLPENTPCQASYHYPAKTLEGYGGDGSFIHLKDTVREFYPLAQGPSPTAGPDALYDPRIRVWGDFGRPTEAPTYRCSLLGVPSSATRSTGGLIQYADCQLDFAVGHALAEVGLGFEDPYHPEADCNHPLNRDGIWETPHDCQPGAGVWEEGSGRPTFTTWDCSRPRDVAAVGEYTDGRGEQVWLVQVPAPEIRADHPTDGSLYDALWHTTTFCQGPTGVMPTNMEYVRDNTQMRYMESGRRPFMNYLMSGKPLPDPLAPKRTTDFTLRSYSPEGLAALEQPTPGHDHYLNLRWGSLEGYAAPAYLGGALRTRDAEPAGPVWTTAYANLPLEIRAAFALPRTDEGFYGGHACGIGAEDPANAWDCDRERWWDPEAGARAEPRIEDTGSPMVRTRIGARVDDPYQLRDVDCYDGHVAGDLAYASLVQLGTGGTCP